MNMSKQILGRWVKIATGMVLSFSLAGASVVWAQSDDATGLKLPGDLQVTQRGNLVIQEHRVGGRLDSVSIRHKGGVTEVFDNDKPGDLWVHEENELGDTPNIRKWTIGTW